MKRACFPYCLLMLANEIMGGYQRPISVRYFCFSSRRQPPFRPTLAGAQYTSAFVGARATSARRDPCRIISGRGFDSRQTPPSYRRGRPHNSAVDLVSHWRTSDQKTEGGEPIESTEGN